jgi:LysM repeat protein
VAAVATPEPQVATSQVSVLKGQNLWSIAESGSVYGDHWLWPLLYIYNRDKIADPDIIEPGWQLLVKADVAADVKQQQAAKAQETPRYVPHTTPRSHLPIEY